jgi:hypothetical protein
MVNGVSRAAGHEESKVGSIKNLTVLPIARPDAAAEVLTGEALFFG